MNQLTQMELAHLEELLSMEVLAAKKYRIYSRQCSDKELIPLFEEARELHRQRVDGLLQLLRKHNGKSKKAH
ncbi:hypothetical protein [Thermoflavimicrobium daqui]|jgi:hypothetical protein|uniref:Spore coat protein n=1 Tax=Thermoflavimicrobium daqui TaxID=2137476 RepID=A0A364K5Q9_9BACL|nr:hypothetical protein [Thermoflavimicrobium daqui]RAL25636.1 hypothetical protein DL897_06035 [Thermoflavimicrobium daqui]